MNKPYDMDFDYGYTTQPYYGLMTDQLIFYTSTVTHY